MKKILSSVLAILFVFSLVTVSVEAKKKESGLTASEYRTKVEKTSRQSKKFDIIKDEEYAQIKREFFDAEGYGQTFNCKVEKQKFCKVKNFESGLYVLCDRDVSRTQMESAKIFYQLGRCVSIN